MGGEEHDLEYTVWKDLLPQRTQEPHQIDNDSILDKICAKACPRVI
jgi:hypothetical protein